MTRVFIEAMQRITMDYSKNQDLEAEALAQEA